ncbi:hypothetical protein [Brevundimonas sp. CEF1]|uniref:hypothetical protein n=1 Tax=Brevundimonas sp. CEF1 TaxID=3442642 RepID=UPI003F517158
MAIPLSTTIINGLGYGSLATTGAPAALGSASRGSSAQSARADHVHPQANSPDATLLNRANHTGTQAVGTITGLANSATITATGAAWTPSTLVQRDASGHVSARKYLASGDGTGGFAIGSREMGINGANFSFNVTLFAPAFTPTCDLDLKENIEAVSNDPAAVRDVLSAGQIQYDRVQDGVHALGFSAQALREINPLWTVGGEALDPEGPVEDLEGAVVDEDGVTFRRPLAVDPMAMISSLFAAVRQLANDTGYLEARHEQALSRIEALEAEVAALTAA